VAQNFLRFGVSGLGPEVRGVGIGVCGSAVECKMVLRQQSDSASTVLVYYWVVLGYELELGNFGSRAPRRLFVVQGPMALHIELGVIGESCISKIHCVNRALEISALRQWGWGTKRIE